MLFWRITQPANWDGCCDFAPNVKVHFKNLFLLFLIVTSCIKVGNNEESSHKRSFLNNKKCDITIKNGDLIEKSFAFITTRVTTTRNTTRKKQATNKGQKVGPFLFSNSKHIYNLKWISFLIFCCVHFIFGVRSSFCLRIVTYFSIQNFKTFKLTLTNLFNIINKWNENYTKHKTLRFLKLIVKILQKNLNEIVTNFKLNEILTDFKKQNCNVNTIRKLLNIKLILRWPSRVEIMNKLKLWTRN